MLQTAEILLIISPSDIARVYIENQRVPFLSGQVSTAASTFEFLLKARTPIEESAGVPRVAKNTCNSVVLQIASADFGRTSAPPNQSRKLPSLLAKLLRHSKRRADSTEYVE